MALLKKAKVLKALIVVLCVYAIVELRNVLKRRSDLANLKNPLKLKIEQEFLEQQKNELAKVANNREHVAPYFMRNAAPQRFGKNGLFENDGLALQPLRKLSKQKNQTKQDNEAKPKSNKNEPASNGYKYRDKYLQGVNAERLNRLLAKIAQKEASYEPIIDELKLFSFKQFLSNSPESMSTWKMFEHEYQNYLVAKDQRVEVTDKFVDYLHELSNNYTFDHRGSRTSVTKGPVDDVANT